jgi:hypothetical protein
MAKPDPRVRSVSTSRIYQGSGPRVTRKSSLGIKGTASGLPGRDMYNWPKNSSASPRGARKLQRNRESKATGNVMNGSEEGDESNPDQTAQGRGRLYPVSKATNDLISFLEDGPPPELQPVRSATESANSLTPTTKSAKSGNRLQRMISKFNLSQDASRGRGIGVRSAPSTPVSSVRYLDASNSPPVPIAMKPVPPPLPQLAPISPPSSRTSSAEDDARSHTSRTDRPSRKMSVRKAVPTWESMVDQDQGLQTPQTGGEKMLPPSPPMSPPPASVSSPSPSQPTPNPSPEGKEMNGVTHNKVLQSESPAGTEAHPHPPTREIGNGRAEHQGVTRPRSHRANIRSPSDDRQPHSVRRSSARRTHPPNGSVDHSQPVHPSPTLSEAIALDLRRLMSQATTADECRLLVDTFLTRVGIAPPLDPSPAVDSTPPDADAERLEQTLVNYFLGADLDGSKVPQTRSVQVQAEVEVECQSNSSPPKQAQEGDDAHLKTATLMDSAHAVHSHHIVSNAVAVVS